MLEILFIVFLCKKLAAMARNKGRTAAGYCTLLVLAWVGGEMAGIIGGMIAFPTQGGGFNGAAYLCALIGAGVGVTLVFVLVNALSSKLPQRAGYAATGGFPVVQRPPM
jgi:predicted lipid-binding transport protein (Tim44 family)